MKRFLGGARAIVIASTMLVLGVALGSVGSSAAGAATPVSAFYLAIGGSGSLGVQPTAGYPKGERTDEGYADYLVAAEATNGVTLDLHEIGCSGETTYSMLHGGDHCYSSPDTQLNEAISFLQAHQNENGLVTIDLGFNDLLPCVHDHWRSSTCVGRQLGAVRTQLTEIVGLLEDAAGPDVEFVGVGHYDPYLADTLRDREGAHLAASSLHMVRRLDAVLTSVYSSLAFRLPTSEVRSGLTVRRQCSRAIARSPRMLPRYACSRGCVNRHRSVPTSIQTMPATRRSPLPSKRS